MNALEPRNAVEQILLDGNGDELLNFGGRQAERLGLYLHRRRVEFRIHIDGRGLELARGDKKQSKGHGYDEAAETHARADKPMHDS